LAFNLTDKDHSGKVDLHAERDILTPSGVVGDNVTETAGRNIKGLVVAFQSATIAAPSVNVTVQAPVTDAPNNQGLTYNATEAPAAPPVQAPQQTQTQEEKKNVIANPDDEDEEKKKKREKESPVLSKTTGRVTVILPD